MARRDWETVGYQWMGQAACVEHPSLPWIGPDHDDWDHWADPITDVARMRQICDDCPVRAACETYVTQADVTAGFWAGRWRRDRRSMPHTGRRAA
ncbi:hypothetical protein GCM10011575_44080 [Microlunatus endophyticus]|uniref:4Fe-4S Wbl-type domain-containing protein n=1 Tax=Microlunatus endophyticus TaxID=1716077 RepID=A0A917W7U7_9ACTN|nr:WhiB family transcriptional regulator [Microlunatus endophyticus]GGL80943.1 hypothetical protein GCM10011575_44080 [Microlunatus endophyticus]